jgi:hypothetical protein
VPKTLSGIRVEFTIGMVVIHWRPRRFITLASREPIPKTVDVDDPTLSGGCVRLACNPQPTYP